MGIDARLLDLVERAQAGDREAFGKLYDEYADRLFRFIKIKIQHSQQAEDILQDSFIKVWRNLRQFEPTRTGSFQAWVYRITLNCINDHFRQMYRKPEALELNENWDKASGENLAKEVGDRIETEKLKNSFNFLPKQYSVVLELRFVQDLPLDEVSKILNKSNLAVRVLQHRALKKLRQIIKENNDLGYSKI